MVLVKPGKFGERLALTGKPIPSRSCESRGCNDHVDSREAVSCPRQIGLADPDEMI